MGQIVSVYTNGSDNTNGGISARHRQLTVVNVEGPFLPVEHRPAALLVPNALGTLIVVPAQRASIDDDWVPLQRPDMVGPMMGGNYAASSDARWVKAIKFYGAVPIHDRFETPELYASMSE